MNHSLRSWSKNLWISKAILLTVTACAPALPVVPESTCADIKGGDLKITEVMPDPWGSDTSKQYIEVYNTTGHNLDLNGISLFRSLIDGSRQCLVALKPAKIAPSSYFVFGDTGDAAELRPKYIDYGYGSALGTLRHENGRVGLRCDTMLIDQVNYAAVDAGRSWQLDGDSVPTAALNETSRWCNSVQPLDALDPPGENFGTPGEANDPCPSSDAEAPTAAPATTVEGDAGAQPPQCLDDTSGAERSLVNPKPGDLLINEIQAAPSVGNNGPGEWFEVLVRSNIDLNGLELANEGTGKTVLSSNRCLAVKPGDLLVFARSADPAQNGGLPAVRGVFSFALADSTSSTVSQRAVTLRFGADVIDRVPWTKSTLGASLQRSASALDARPGTSVEWCTTPAGSTYGLSDRGTPAAANVACVSDGVDAGALVGCRDTGGNLRALVPPDVGDLVISEVMAAPSTGNNGPGEWFEIYAKSTVDLNDLELGNEGTARTSLSSDDCLNVQAGSWLTFARSTDSSLNGGLPEVFAAFSFTLADSSSSTYPERAVVLRLYGNELSRASWKNSVRGRSLQLSLDQPDKDAGRDPPSWCLTPSGTQFGAGDQGTPGSENLPCE